MRGDDQSYYLPPPRCGQRTRRLFLVRWRKRAFGGVERSVSEQQAAETCFEPTFQYEADSDPEHGKGERQDYPYQGRCMS